MSAKSKADLTTEIAALITGQTTPESISPASVGQLAQDIVDSMLDRVDDPLILSPISMTKAQLAAAIIGAILNDGQQITITDRADGFPLIVKSKGTNLIHPFATWVKSGLPLAVIIDYTGGSEGETNPFIAVFDENDNLNLSQNVIIADSSKGVGKILVSDANGKGTWTSAVAAYYQGGVLSPALLAGGGTALMAGLAGSIAPTKTGKVLITIHGEYTSDTTASNTNFLIKTDTGSAPANGAANTGTAQIITSRHATSATERQSFSISVLASLTPGSTYWIDMAASNNGEGNVQFFNTTITAIEL